MTNLPSALSPALKPPPHLHSHARRLQPSTGNTSLLCPPHRTRDPSPPTIKALAEVQCLQDFLRLSHFASHLKVARANYDQCELLHPHPNSTPGDSRTRTTKQRRWRSHWCDRQFIHHKHNLHVGNSNEVNRTVLDPLHLLWRVFRGLNSC